VGEKPRPPHSPRTRAGVVVATGATEERKLIAVGRGRRAGGGIGRRVGDDFGAERGVTRQHPEVAQQVKTGEDLETLWVALDAASTTRETFEDLRNKNLARETDEDSFY
jgi:hypothetical protein